jgi:hypothetical protein
LKYGGNFLLKKKYKRKENPKNKIKEQEKEVFF